MKHLLICREYPPASSGGIGTYAVHMARLLAEAGETVHVLGRLARGAPRPVERLLGGRLVVHRVPYKDPGFYRATYGRAVPDEVRALLSSGFPPQAFAWEAALLAERIVEDEGIDVIECQEYQAPLYFFQLRRALGLGPARQPPCLVHLHSPLELIVQPDDADIAAAYLETATRLERYTIAAADALLAPSRYLARQAEQHYALAAGSVEVIPLPVGDTRVLERAAATWRSGSICYVGRLEPRKGTLEWLEAAVAVAEDFPEARFEFVGAAERPYMGVMPIGDLLRRRTPPHLRDRFRFHGRVPRERIPAFLARARMATVPSRWENFPNTCVEAMGSGLPVIATREGGMAEMIEDGETGWLADLPTSGELERQLRRALATPPATLARMGRAAAARIRELSDNRRIVAAQLDLRRRVAETGADASRRLPPALAGLDGGGTGVPPVAKPADPAGAGIAAVVRCLDDAEGLRRTLRSLAAQTTPVADLVVVDDGSADPATLRRLRRLVAQGVRVEPGRCRGPAAARNIGLEIVLRNRMPLGVVFLEAGDELEPACLAQAEAALRASPELAIVSFWYHDAGGIRTPPCPVFPYQWVANDAAPFSVIRTAAFESGPRFAEPFHHGYETWDLFNSILAHGGYAVTIPAILGRAGAAHHGLPLGSQSHAAMHRAMLQRHQGPVAAQLGRIVAVSLPRLRRPGTAAPPLDGRGLRGAARAVLNWSRGTWGRLAAGKDGAG